MADASPVVPLIRHGLRHATFPQGGEGFGRGDGLPRRCAPRNDRVGDAGGPLRPLRGHLPQRGRQVGRLSKKRPWLPLWGSWHGEAVTERVTPVNATVIAGGQRPPLRGIMVNRCRGGYHPPAIPVRRRRAANSRPYMMRRKSHVGAAVPSGPPLPGRPSNGRMGTSAPTPGHDASRRGGLWPPADNGCTNEKQKPPPET